MHAAELPHSKCPTSKPPSGSSQSIPERLCNGRAQPSLPLPHPCYCTPTSLPFYTNFFSHLGARLSLPSPPAASVILANHPFPILSLSLSLPPPTSSPPAPILTLNSHPPSCHAASASPPHFALIHDVPTERIFQTHRALPLVLLLPHPTHPPPPPFALCAPWPSQQCVRIL